jgi:hypothetical protein
MLYTDVCGRMLTYADVCLTYAAARSDERPSCSGDAKAASKLREAMSQLGSKTGVEAVAAGEELAQASACRMHASTASLRACVYAS